MEKEKNVMEMSQEEIVEAYRKIFEASESSLLQQPQKSEFTFDRASVLKETSVSYSLRAGV